MVLLGLSGCLPPPRGPSRALPEVWVDAFAPAGGDGSSAAPFKALPDPIPVAVLRLRSGLYSGPFVVPEGARLRGEGEVVLTSNGDGPTVTAHRASLQQLTIQGGAIGLEATEVVLDGVTFSGQRTAAVQANGALRGRRLRFIASVEGVDGVVAKDARLLLSELRFQGGFRRAIDVSGGELRLGGATFEGAKTAVRALDADSRVQVVDATGGSAVAFFFAGGSLKAAQVDVQGHEYALQLARGVTATVEDLFARGAAQACVSINDAQLELTRARLSRCGAGGSVSALGSRLTANELVVRDGRELGVLVRKGEANLQQLDVRGIAGGDAVHVRDAEVTIGSAQLADASGSGLFVSAQARVTFERLLVERAAQSALFVERGATVELGEVLVRGGGGPAVLLPDAATVKLRSLSVSGGREQPIYAECAQGALVTVGRLESTIAQLPSACVTR